MIADDHQMVIDGIMAMLQGDEEINVQCTANNGREALDRMAANPGVQVAVLDINMPEMDGLECTRLLSERYPELKILILTMHNHNRMVKEVLEAGADGYILKNTGKDEFKTAIRRVAAGSSYYSAEVMQAMMDSYRQAENENKLLDVPLSDRELQIIDLISQEKTMTEIGQELNISEHTVKTHRKNIFRKLDVKNTAGLIRIAMERGLIG